MNYEEATTTAQRIIESSGGLTWAEPCEVPGKPGTWFVQTTIRAFNPALARFLPSEEDRAWFERSLEDPGFWETTIPDIARTVSLTGSR